MYFPSISTTKDYTLAAMYNFCGNFKINNYVYMPFFTFLNLTFLPGGERGQSNY